MRVKAVSGPLAVQAIAGSYAVTLGFDHDRAAMDGVHGFAVERLDHTEGKRAWLSNRIRYAGVSSWGSNWNPFQTFSWGDYRAKPEHSYTYLVHAMGGTPGQELQPRSSVSLQVATEPPDAHGIWFNRGAFASQAYAERFKNLPPDQVPNREAWKWLSRGLEEAILGFIGQANQSGWELHASFYEFRHAPVLEAFGVAAAAGAQVQLIVDDTPENHDAVAAAGIDHLVVTWRKRAVIPHNKFVVASRHGVALAVWTGSTNITENGIFGQSNVGHRVTDTPTADRYLDYWAQLKADPTHGVLVKWVDANSAVPDTWPVGTTVIFSPHSALTALERYANLFGAATGLACGTFPFKLDSRFADLLPGDHEAVRWLLFEDPKVAGGAAAGVTDADTVIAAGAFLPEGGLSGFAGELKNPLSHNVEYIHSKYLLIDPLGDDPIVVTGSANFSNASTNKNDENMLIIRGNPAVADVYFSEFFRLFNHYRFRYSLGLKPSDPTPGPETGTEAPRTLDDANGWWAKHYDEPARAKQRKLLAGTL